MRETLNTQPDLIDEPENLSHEQRMLQKQRARIEAAIQALLEEREAIKQEARDGASLVQRFRLIGARAHIYTALNRLQLDLQVIKERELSEQHRYTYVEPIVFDEPTDE